MFKIGDFSKMSRVSVKTLRYYDEVGLISPARVDEFTGYRYYSADQLPRLNRILALKDLGFSLEQIASLMDDGLPTPHIREMLTLRQREIREQIEADRMRLELVEMRLQQIEREGAMPGHDVVIKSIEPLTVASVRGIILSYNQIGELFVKLMGHLIPSRARLVGPPMALYHDAEYKEQDVDIEVAIPVDPSTSGADHVRVYRLPKVEAAACMVHKGDYNLLPGSYEVLMSWIQANDYRMTGIDRNVYLRSYTETQNPAEFVTEIQIPVTKAAEVSKNDQ